MRLQQVTWLFLFILAGCGHSQAFLSENTQDNKNPPRLNRNGQNPDSNLATNASTCPEFLPPTILGRIENRDIIEASGIVASRKNSGLLWIHNDGDDSRIFAVTHAGRTAAIYSIEGLSDQDWEDIGIGPGVQTGQDYLYIGDIGSAGSLPVTIYRFLEPSVDENQALVETTVSAAERIDLVYPDNDNYDAETLFVDPNNGDIYIVTKTGQRSFVFRKRAPHRNAETTVMELAATLNLTQLPGNHSTTGGDMSADGNFIVIRTYSHAFLWQVPNGNVAAAWDANPCATIALTGEPQGEAIAFTPEGDLLTTSEQRHQPIYLYRRR